MPIEYQIKKWFTLTFLGTASALLLTFVSTASSIYFYGSRNQAIRADAAIVLGAAVWGDQPSPVFKERINHAINLYKKGIVRSIIFTGGIGENKEHPESVVGKRYAIKRGVKEADILVETESRTTYQNLTKAWEVASPRQFSKFLIVSDPLHLKRAVFMARNMGMDAYPSATPTTRYRTLKTQFQFLMRETYFYFVYLVLGY
ncbi:MAG: YdcF family protein [Scytonema sp. PMC 1069.18]|nr:YdcF family protein [Scytonema sp. PMC 1069.18]MEC4882378.1 YdcF family protein [Scytonema sp. PMC 1070.18]